MIPAKRLMSSQRCREADGGTNAPGDTVLHVQGPPVGSLKLSSQFSSCGPMVWEFLGVFGGDRGPGTQPHCCVLAMMEQSQGPVPFAELGCLPVSGRVGVVLVQLF